MCRWTENWQWFVKRLNVTSDLHGDTFFRVTFEQSVFRDATCSAMLQKPRFYHRCAIPFHVCTTALLLWGCSYDRTAVCSLSPRDKQRWPFPWWDTEWRERHTKACRWWNKTAPVPIPDSWQPFTRADSQQVKHVSLRLPQSGGEYPEEWGHDPFPLERGPFSRAFQDWLRRDVPQMWVDVDSADDPGARSLANR